MHPGQRQTGGVQAAHLIPINTERPLHQVRRLAPDHPYATGFTHVCFHTTTDEAGETSYCNMLIKCFRKNNDPKRCFQTSKAGDHLKA